MVSTIYKTNIPWLTTTHLMLIKYINKMLLSSTYIYLSKYHDFLKFLIFLNYKYLNTSILY